MSSTDHGRLARLARLVLRRRRAVIAAWLAALVAVAVLAPRIAGDHEADYATPGSDSAAAADLVAERFPGSSGEAVDVVWTAPDGAGDPAALRRVGALLDRAEALEGIGTAGPPEISGDGRVGIARLELDRPSWDVPLDTAERLIDLAEDAGGGGLRVELGGGLIQAAQGGGEPELIGLAAAAVVLLVAFGSVVAMGLPIAVALVGLGISASLIGAAAALLDVPDWAPAVAALIGIGVGIDYALLILTRFRAALARGREVPDAVVEATRTAGHSVLVAGGTVVVSLLGLMLMGVSYLRGTAVAAILAVLVVMAAAITLLPALLSVVGRRVDALRLPGLARAPRPGRETPAARWARAVQRRPRAAALGALGLVLALAAPALGLRLGFPDAGNDPRGTTTRAAYDLVAEGFGPGANGPLLVTAELPQGAGGAALGRLTGALRTDPAVAAVEGPRIAPGGDAAILMVTPATAPQAEATSGLVERLRDEIAPAAAADLGGRVLVGGATAAFVDQADWVGARLPVVIAAVVGLSLLVLLVAFRAPVVAATAAVMNLLSVAAAYGVVALFAGGGWPGGLVGIDDPTPVAPFIPVMMFAILFGLSMDYEVFLLSRVREEHLRHGDAARAVVDGVAATARVITAAAAIIIVVFLAFLSSPEVFLKLMGLGMAAAILVDATIVRLVLVPAVMAILGPANWWLPGWLARRLPERGGARRPRFG